MSDPDVLEELEETLVEATGNVTPSGKNEFQLLKEVEMLKAENNRLRLQLDVLRRNSLDRPLPCSIDMKVHYLYAAPLVLVDSLGSTVIETLDPIRADRESVGIGPALSSLSIACPGALMRLKYLLEEERVSVLHISMHTVDLATGGGTRSVRCALEDDTGRGYLMTPDEFASSLGTIEGSVKLLFVNACKSVDVARAILKRSPSLLFAICSGNQEPVLESTAQVFASELYAALANKEDIASAFERARLSVKTNTSFKISSQADLFQLLAGSTNGDLCFFNSLAGTVGTLPRSRFWIGHVSADLAVAPEDFIGREIDIVRLSGVVFSGAGRRVFSITGDSGMGKSIFLAEACKYFATPGGRNLSGGFCLVRLPESGDQVEKYEEQFLSAIVEGLRETVSSFRSWHPKTHDSTKTSHHEEEATEDSLSAEVGRTRLDSASEECSAALTIASSSLKSYKVFWAETFQSEQELVSFLDSYALQLPEESAARLYAELRLNGTQLQDWGSGRLIRVVHVVRLLIKGDHGQYLLENKGGQLRMLSKKFDPVTENVLEVASAAVRKELGTEIAGKLIGMSRVVLRDRKPMVEINKTSPSYPGLATKYVLYTADVSLSNLPMDKPKFTTHEGQEKIHAWEWIRGDSSELVSLLPANDALILRKNSSALEVHVTGQTLTLSMENPLHAEYSRLVREWASLCDQHHNRHRGSVTSALVLLNADKYLEHPPVRQLLGKALVRHPGLKILFSQDSYSFDTKPILNLPTSAVSYKIVHFPLGPLQPIDAAVLFTRRIHRPLFNRDWWIDLEAVPPPLGSMGSREALALVEEIDENAPLIMNLKSSKGLANLARLARHPVLTATEGIPEKILKISQMVTAQLPSINDLVHKSFTDFQAI
jgi:hypothetical protein